MKLESFHTLTGNRCNLDETISQLMIDKIDAMNIAIFPEEDFRYISCEKLIRIALPLELERKISNLAGKLRLPFSAIVRKILIEIIYNDCS
ncbi:hypothetical protein [Prochlorococcus sp. MIT 1341]|uniref:hypothetical protein n=1 Tax=Prochlorococcus sp. MIT 1341 TaxID=3096221 RepID=UPI002A75C15D|nr:hypothetical protein [Prochlorococcus sp. MIT 1341]